MSIVSHFLLRWLPRYRKIALPCIRVFGGHHILLRRLEAGDAPRLSEFFATHTPETIRARYGYAISALSPEEVLRRVAVDQLRDAALGAFERDDAGSHLVAIARYCLAANERSAEMAFVVREDRRCLGIATVLLQALIQIARARRVPLLKAHVQVDNTPMLAVFRACGAQFSSRRDHDGIEIYLPVPAPHGAQLSAWWVHQWRSARRHVRLTAEHLWLWFENACSRLLGNYPLP